MNFVVRQTPHGKRLIPLPDEERDKLFEQGRIRRLKPRLYVEVPPASEPVVSRVAPVYATKVMTPERASSRRNKVP